MAIKERIHRMALSFSFFVLLTEFSYSQTDKLLQGQLLKDGDELVSAFGNFRLGFFSPHGKTERYLGIWYHRTTDRTGLYNSFCDRNPNSERCVTYRSVWEDCLGACIGTPTSMRSRSCEVDCYCRLAYSMHTQCTPGYVYDPTLWAVNCQKVNLNSDPVWVANRNFPILGNESSSLTIDSSDGNLKILRNDGSPIEITSVPKVGNTSAILLKNGNFVLYEMDSNGSIKRELWQSFDYPTNTLLPGMKLGMNLKTQHKWFLQSWNYGSHGNGPYVLGMEPNISNKLVIWKGREVLWKSDELLQNKSSSPSYPWVSLYNFSYTSSEEEGYLSYSVNEKVTSYPVLTIGAAGGLVDDTGRDILCAAFGGCPEDNGNIYPYYPPSPIFREEKKKWWLSLIIAVAVCLLVCLLLSIGYLIRRKYYKTEDEKWWMSLIIVVAIASVAAPLCYFSFLLLKQLKAKVESIMNRQKLLCELGDNNLSLRTIFRKGKQHAKSRAIKRDLKIFDFQTIAAATDNFSAANRLGQGGFGPVYKGKLLDGQEIAIKRLSKSSGQGIVEFKNEAKLIAKLQHTNLVRLLGCSLQGGERLLVYEYLPNKSLDFFIFDSTRKALLNWKKRFEIIEGIAQGLLYLHKYSRLRVIHRDLKASNILLDEQMNPKISDFGMAKTFAMNELEANTNRIVGTHGYMSPEYVLNGIVSMKSDVYSFGVLVLEMVSSKKNTSCYDTERPLNLVGYAWQLWNEGKGLDLIDQIKDDSCSPEEILRCIHVGLLCVQDRATDRPTMSDVVSMLTNDSMALPAPKQPAFFINVASDLEPEVTEIKLELCSVNDVTISGMEAR
ncbi:putative Receptor protein kinase [Melia azedarach]|uniref:Receptor protein kinase n=1 Tax=Melia azedarach TaxID=155640 RepID=A0ACC1Y347_MELAZ|nr:putative Receptor protein kinase [Melia azedarach]